MDWVRWAFGNPFSDGPGMLTLTLILRALSAAFAGFLRKRRGLGVAMFAAMIGSFGFFVIFTLTHRFGPLSLLGLAMMFTLGLIVALPTVGVIRAALGWLGSNPREDRIAGGGPHAPAPCERVAI